MDFRRTFVVCLFALLALTLTQCTPGGDSGGVGSAGGLDLGKGGGDAETVYGVIHRPEDITVTGQPGNSVTFTLTGENTVVATGPFEGLRVRFWWVTTQEVIDIQNSLNVDYTVSAGAALLGEVTPTAGSFTADVVVEESFDQHVILISLVSVGYPGNQIRVSAVTDIITTENLEGTISLAAFTEFAPGLLYPTEVADVETRVTALFREGIWTPFARNCSEGTTQSNPLSANGSGTIFDPYLVCNYTHLKEMDGLDLSRVFMLGDDIFAFSSGSEGDVQGNQGFKPINNFSGRFYGRGRTISDLMMIRFTDQHVALFSTTTNAFIFDVTLSQVDFSSDYQGSGPEEGTLAGLVGLANTTVIRNCHVSGGDIFAVVSSSDVDYTGGIVGSQINGQMSYVTCSANLENRIYASRVGGIVGKNATTDLYRVGYTGTSVNGVAQTIIAGGLVGWNSSSNISQSYVKGTQVTGDSNVGGLIGWNDNAGKVVSDCYVEGGQSTGGSGGSPSNAVGGFVGHLTAGIIQNSYTSQTTQGGSVGGFVGMSDASITNSYAVGLPSGNPATLGLFVGESTVDNYSGSYYFDPQIGIGHVGQGSATLGQELTVSAFNAANHPVYGVVWDFTNIWQDNSGTGSRPTLRWEGN